MKQVSYDGEKKEVLIMGLTHNNAFWLYRSINIG